MTDRHIIYQDYAEPPSLGVPSCASWMPEPNQPEKSSWARKWSIAALTALTIAYVGEPIAPAEAVTPDKWYQQLSVPTLPKPSLHASLQQTTAYAGEPIAPLFGNATELLVYPDLEQPPVSDGPITLQGEFAYAAPSATSDIRWLQPFSEPVRAKLRFEYPQPAFVEDFVGAPPETITLDKWYQEFSTPRSVRPHFEAPQEAIDPWILTQPEETHIQWLVPLSEPVLPKPSVAYQQETTTDPDLLTRPEVTSPDKWLRAFEEPVRVAPRALDAQWEAFVEDFTAPPAVPDYSWAVPSLDPLPREGTLIVGDFAFIESEVTDISWYRQLETPVWVKTGYDLTQFAFVEDFVAGETVTLDKWFQPFSEPLLAKRATLEGQYVVDPDLLTRPEEVHVQWFAQFSEPVRVAPVPTLEGAFSFVEDVATTDVEWMQPLSTPTLPKARVAHSEFAFVEHFEPKAIDWFQGWVEPSRPPESAIQIAFAIVEDFITAEEVTLDKWHQPLSEPLRIAHAIVEGAVGFVEDFVPPEDVTLDKWFRPLSEPTLPRPYCLEGYLAFVEYIPSPDITWAPPLSEPTLPAPRVVEFPSFAFVEDFVPPAMDTWFRQLETPPKAKPRAASYYIGLYQGDPSGFVEPTPEVPQPPFEKIWTPDSATTAGWTSETQVAGGWSSESPPVASWTEEDPIEC